MKKILLSLCVSFLIGGYSFAQMQLRLPDDYELSKMNLDKHTHQTNLQLSLPNTVALSESPSDLHRMWLIGLAADLTFPLGEEFKHVAGTAFSAHVMLGYAVTRSLLINLRAGYIKFADQTEEGTDFKYEDSFNQIPILLGLYYSIATGGKIKPYVGLALGLFLLKYSYAWTYNFGFSQNTQSGDATSSEFGIVPAAGFTYPVSPTMLLHFGIEYALLFGSIPTVEGNTELDKNLSQFSILAGVLFALGGR